VVIYLNDGFDGGSTEFLEGGLHIGDEDSEISETVDTGTSGTSNTSEMLFSTTNKTIACVTPSTGNCLIFPHDALHQSRPVYCGVKYILRTEIIFQRVDTHLQENPMAFQDDPKYIKFLKLYHKSQESLEVGNPGEFFDLYYQALKLQLEAQRKSQLPRVTNLSKRTFPEETWLHVLSYLGPWNLVQLLPVSKDMYDLAIDGQLWKPLYENRWLQNSSPSSTSSNRGHRETPDFCLSPYLEDWYQKYWFQYLLATSPNVVDFGTCTLKYLSHNVGTVFPFKSPNDSQNRKLFSLPANYRMRPVQTRHYRSNHGPELEFGIGTPILTKNVKDPKGRSWELPTQAWPFMLQFFSFNRRPTIFLNSPYPRITFPKRVFVRETSVCALKSYKLRSGVVVSFGHSGAWLQIVLREKIVATSISCAPVIPRKYSEFLASGFSKWLSEQTEVSSDFEFQFCFIGGKAVQENVDVFLSCLYLACPLVHFKVASTPVDRFYAPLVGALKFLKPNRK
jgi:hypothetical protein